MLHGKKVAADKLFALMGMGIKVGDTITVEVEGEGEAAVATALQELLAEIA